MHKNIKRCKDKICFDFWDFLRIKKRKMCEKYSKKPPGRASAGQLGGIEFKTYYW